MAGYEDAWRAALSRVLGKMRFYCCAEHGNAHVFSRNDNMSFGGWLVRGQKGVR